MKLFRFGSLGQERPGALDADGVQRDLSAMVDDLSGLSLAPEQMEKLKYADLTSCPVVRGDERLGPCVGDVHNFIAVGLNYAEHAAESGVELPGEPVLFNKAPSCIVGPYDDIHIPPGSAKTGIPRCPRNSPRYCRWYQELGLG